MILSDHGIRKALRDGEIEIDPLPSDVCYTSSAVDLTLGDHFQSWDYDRLCNTPGSTTLLDLAQQNYQSTARSNLIAVPIESDGAYIFHPYHKKPMVLLAKTKEKVHLKKESLLAARVEGKSSLARIGLMVHLTAPTIHSGFKGTITLELINHSPFYLRLVPGCQICQLIFEKLESTSDGGIRTSFQNQSEPSGLR